MQSQRRTDTSFACPLVGRRDLERRQAMHRDKIQRMGSSIDTRSPAPQPHLTLYGRDYVSKKRATTEAAFSDLKMIQSIARTMTRKPNIPERKGPTSLNADARKTEIFRIMKENHRLLDRLETLDPVVSTNDLIRDHNNRQRYTILVSHSKRLAGEYDDDVNRILTEDKAKRDAMNRSVQARLTKFERLRMQNSNSMPSLTPMAATDPGVGIASAKGSSSPPKGRGKPVVTKQLGVSGGLGSSSSSTKSAPNLQFPGPTPGPSPGQQATADANATTGVSSSPTQDDKPKVNFEGGENQASSDAAVPEASIPTDPPQSMQESRELPADLQAMIPTEPAAESAPVQESRELPADLQAEVPVVEQQSRELVFDQPAADEPVLAPPEESPQVGLSASGPSADAAPADQSKVSESAEDYSADFADDTMNSMSKAQGLDETSASFTESKES